MKKFFEKTKVEFGRISWLSKADVGKQTGMVVASTVVLAIMISAIDFCGQWLVNLILGIHF